MPLIREIHRFYGGYDNRRRPKYDAERMPRYGPDGRRWYPQRRHHRPLSPIVRTPLQLLVLVAIGAAIAQFLPALWCMMIQFASVIAIGAVVYFCYKLFSRR